MAIRKDPEGNETSTLHRMVDFQDQRVLEIGCGDGRLTWRYAGRAAHVTAIDPDSAEIAKARAGLPPELAERVNFRQSSYDDYLNSPTETGFDIALFSWSL